jgi:xanthine/uracil permease
VATKTRGRPVLGGICGIFFGLFLSVALTVYAGVALNSPLHIILVAAGFVVGVALGLIAPFGRSRTGAHAAGRGH